MSPMRIEPGQTHFFLKVIAILFDERRYQDVQHGPISEHPHTVFEWIGIMEKELAEAKEAWMKRQGDDAALAEVVQVVATGLACFEQHGVVPGHSAPRNRAASVDFDAFMRP